MININIESKKFNCNITLNQKVTVIRGNSGRGKTVFTKAIDENSGAYKISVSDTSYELYVLHSKGWYEIIEYGITNNKKRIYIIDDLDFIATSEFSHLFSRDKTCFYILINRFDTFGIKSVNRIPFSANEVYEFVANGKEHTIQKYYRYSNIDLRYKRINMIVTEDSSSGLDFFKRNYKRVSVTTLDGKDKALNYFKNNLKILKGKSIALFIDMAAFGSLYQMIYEYITLNKLDITLIQEYNSFEYMLLSSNMFKYNFSNINNELIASEASFEQLCTSLISKLTSNKPYLYKKSDLNNCYILDCCCKSQRIGHGIANYCDKGLKGSKFEALFRNTVFDEILYIGN